jgi:predicted nucleic acid-binding Zn ribbon protein
LPRLLHQALARGAEERPDSGVPELLRLERQRNRILTVIAVALALIVLVLVLAP